AHAAGSDRMVDSIRPQSYGFAQLGLVFAEPAIQHLLADRSHGGCPKDLFGEPDSLDERIQIARIGEEVRVDQGSLANVGALDADLAAAVGPEHADMQGRSRPQVHLSAMIVHIE